MSQQRSSSPGAGSQNEVGEGPFGDRPLKREKLDTCSQLPVMEVSAESDLPPTRASISDLPDEIIVRILSYSTFEELTGVTQNVCSRWRGLSHDPSLWRDKEFCIGLDCSDDEAVAMLQQMPQLRSLVARRVVESSVIEALCDNCPHLTTLEVDASQHISTFLLEKLVQNCANIQSLSISHHILRRRHKARILSKLRRLQSLDVSAHSTRKSHVHLRSFAEGCPELATLKVSQNVNISLEDMECFFNMKCKTLTHLTLPWVSYNRRCVVSLLRDCTSLTHLRLDDCRVVDGGALEALAVLGQLSSLRTLIINDLWGCPAEDAVVLFQSGGLSRLQVLKVTDSSLDDDVVVFVCTSCPELKELYLSKCCNLTSEGLRQLYRLGWI